MVAVKWTEPARDDLAQIHDFIARDSPVAARALVERVLNATEQLASFPESGRIVPELPELGYRELIVGSYRVVYRIGGKTIWIAVVIHGRRLLAELP